MIETSSSSLVDDKMDTPGSSFRSSEANIGVVEVRPVDPTRKSTELGSKGTSVCLKSIVSYFAFKRLF